jgi:hypothetical protein
MQGGRGIQLQEGGEREPGAGGTARKKQAVLTCDGEKQDRASLLTLAELQSV